MEPALPAQFLDLGEDLPDPGPGVPQPHAAQPGCVDQDPAARQGEEVARGGRVTALAVDVTRGPDIHDVLAEQRVGERRLTRAGLAEQHGRTAAHDCGEDVQPLAPRRADRQHGHAGGRGLHVLDEVRQRHRVRHQIRLGEHHDRLRTRLPGVARVVQQCLTARTGHGERQEPLDPPEVEFDRERHADDHVIDVGGQDLTLGTLGRRRPYKGGTARQQRPHVPRLTAFGIDGDPVPRAHDLHRVTGDDELGVGTDGADRGDDVTQATVDPDDTAGQEALLGIRGELRLPVRIPAVRGERV